MTSSALPLPAVTGLCTGCIDATHGQLHYVSTVAAGRGCQVLADLDEHANISFHAASTEGPTVGDRNTHVDELFAGSHRAGTITGSGWKVVDSADEHVWSYYSEEVVTDEGTIQTSGWMDSTVVWAGQWQTLHAVGTSGRYLGLVGVRQIRQIEPRERFQANIVLCDVVRTHRGSGAAAPHGSRS